MKKTSYGTHDIAKICHVTPPTVGRWIEEGKLPCFKTGGGHRRVRDADLVVFLKNHNIPVPSDLEEASIRVLVVDDESDTRRVIVRILQQFYPQMEVHEAIDGFEAGHKIITLHPALVILDLKLPGVDGVKVCQTVRSDQNMKGIKILAISGYAVEESRLQSLAAGADDFLGKPFNFPDLSEKIGKLFPKLARAAGNGA
jgi:excisionase family DNA binding protein